LTLWVFVRFDTAVKPPNRTFHRFINTLFAGCWRDYIVERHHYVSTDRILDFHRAFRRQLKLFTINMALKSDTLFID
jgi:hypothetical protein